VRIILDENIPKYLKIVLVEYDVSTVQEEGWAGMRNGDLISVIDDCFDVLITADKNIKYQRNLTERRIAIVQLYSNRLPLIKQIETKVIDALENVVPGKYIEINA